MTDAPKAPETPVNGILVEAQYEDENVVLNIQRLGDVRPAEVPTLLERATQLARANLGLSR